MSKGMDFGHDCGQPGQNMTKGLDLGVKDVEGFGFWPMAVGCLLNGLGFGTMVRKGLEFGLEVSKGLDFRPKCRRVWVLADGGPVLVEGFGFWYNGSQGSGFWLGNVKGVGLPTSLQFSSLTS